ncbi:hypothetical protein [Sphingopyxis yananensis]|uniref:hypothetical protein n=1 Tax=Sphingopyxis yananensis TaxID=2886687 RepID=UPI001D1195DA|nr:hypothetical protein [Sphingopyxis yananensis]MCC2600848.1 hypothetical protein [Sphingopyxis yananensis]
MAKASVAKISGMLLAATAMVGSPAFAQSGRGGEQNLNGTISNSSPSNDGRRYQVRTLTFEAGKRYSIGVTSDDFDTKLRLSFADDNDETLAEDDDGGDGTNSYLEFIPARTGTYRVRVSSYNDNMGSYVLKIKNLPPLPALLRPNPVSTSTVVFKHFTGELSSSDAVVRNRRVDDYLFRFEAGKQAFIYMDRDGEGLDPHLSVFAENDRNGNNEIASDDDGGDEVNAFISFVPEKTGNYIVRASSIGDESASGRYTLRVGQQP